MHLADFITYQERWQISIVKTAEDHQNLKGIMKSKILRAYKLKIVSIQSIHIFIIV